MSRLRIDRPLVFFDLETTGISPYNDRIVEISAVKVNPGSDPPEVRTRRLNPGLPIPPAATAIHDIGDEEVAEAPAFPLVARSLARFLEGCDLAGFNILKFDLPLLVREFQRAGVDFSTEGRRLIDVLRLYRRLEPRTLTAAVRQFLGEDHEEAHGAEADALATFRVLEGMLARRADLPGDLAGLEEIAGPREARSSDSGGKLRKAGNDHVLGFGKHKGTPLRIMARENPDYLAWILNGDFSDPVKEIVREALTHARENDAAE